MSFYRTKKEKICQRILIFVICDKFIQKIWKRIIDTATKTELDILKTASKNVVCRAA